MADTSVMDSEREQVVRELTRHCGDGRLTLDELEERIAAAYAAGTSAELRLVLRDLPASPKPTPTPPVNPAPPPRQDRIWPPVVHTPTERKGCGVTKKDDNPRGPIGVAVMVSGIVLLVNGFFWWAMLVWFVLPMILKSARRG